MNLYIIMSHDVLSNILITLAQPSIIIIINRHSGLSTV